MFRMFSDYERKNRARSLKMQLWISQVWFAHTDAPGLRTRHASREKQILHAATLIQSWSKKAPLTHCAHRLRGATGSLQSLNFAFSLGKPSKPTSAHPQPWSCQERFHSLQDSEYTWFCLSLTHIHIHTWFHVTQTHTHLIPSLSLTHTHILDSIIHAHTWFHHTQTHTHAHLIPSLSLSHTHTCLHQRVISICLSPLMLL